jgi:hypothetical protein
VCGWVGGLGAGGEGQVLCHLQAGSARRAASVSFVPILMHVCAAAGGGGVEDEREVGGCVVVVGCGSQSFLTALANHQPYSTPFHPFPCCLRSSVRAVCIL